MNTSLRILVTLVLVSMLLLLGLGTSKSRVAAQTSGVYDLTWNTFDSGGVIRSSGGSYLLNGTIGQHDAGDLRRIGVFAQQGGFWPGIQPYYDISLPIVNR
jgi:hypothetical protein